MFIGGARRGNEVFGVQVGQKTGVKSYRAFLTEPEREIIAYIPKCFPVVKSFFKRSFG